MLLVVLAVMAIMMSVAVQTVEFQMRREREAELIFRGQQYVEAIRIFRSKYGRYPMRLKEIWEADPKVIRRKFKDPITDSEKWGLVFLGQEGRTLAGGGRPVGGQGANPTQTPTFQQSDQQSDSPFGGTGPGGERIGPIIGVYSTSCDESIKIFEQHTKYCDWKFVFREQQRQRRGVHAGDYNPTQPGGSGTGPGTPRPGSGDAGGGNPPQPTGSPYN